MKSLGIDIGSSSVKVSLLEIETGECVASSTNPQSEMRIDAPRPGWAEQDPETWWYYACEGIRHISTDHNLREVVSIGITYQMHGLTLLDRAGKPLRKAIIWCDSRAVEIGAEALEQIGRDFCLTHTLNSPGNFTASKLAWVKRNEPEIFDKIHRFMLPGDYIAYRLSGEISTSVSGLSEQILWDFKEEHRADFVADHYGIPHDIIPEAGLSIGIQARTNKATEEALGIPAGTPISYRAGDQPNNAFSLNVMEAGEIAATGGTSGVVYGVVDSPKADPLSRVNTFVHVNHRPEAPRYGILLCINGTGILNAWVRRTVAPEGISYADMNDLTVSVPIGSEGITVIPFGNGAERVLENREIGCSVSGINFNKHGKAHIVRAAQEGIVFSFCYGMEVMQQMGMDIRKIHAGRANMFLSPLFRDTLAGVSGATIELYDTDGSVGAAKGAGIGAGIYKDNNEAFATLDKLQVIEPDEAHRNEYLEAYARWKETLEKQIKQ